MEDFTNTSGVHSDRYGQDFSLFSAYANNQTFMNSLSKRVEKDDYNYTEPKYYLGKFSFLSFFAFFFLFCFLF